MDAFPTIQSLAEADIEAVNARWKGLGYYSRGARLLAAAQKVVNELDGQMPKDAKSMQKELPGVGPYTAGKGLITSFENNLSDGRKTRRCRVFYYIRRTDRCR